MKKILTLILLAVFLSMAVFAFAGDSTWTKQWSSNFVGTAIGPVATYLAIGGTVRMAGHQPVIQQANVTSDAAASQLYLLTENGDSTTSDVAASAAQKNLEVTATTSFDGTTAGAGSWVAIYDFANRKFEVNRVSSLTTGATMSMITNLVNAYANGSTVYELTSIGGSKVGAATKDWPVITLYGQQGETLGWYVDGTSACSVNYIAGAYVQAY